MKTYDEISDAAKDRGAFVHGEKPTEGRVHYRVGFIDGAKWMQEQDQWIPVAERLPDKGQSCNFVVSTKCFTEHLRGKVLGGTYTGTHDNIWDRYEFSTPGHAVNASHWQPSPGAPSSALPISQSDQR